ncbi:putative beta-glucosidase 41-like [Capsicum annuum]|nr:putative beta-glucosidase 41-like [Capsicum annuum]
MGGGGAFRAAAKVAGVTVTNSRFHFVTADHPVYTIAHNVVRLVSISAISLSSEDVKSSIVTAVNGGGGGGLSDVSPMQKVVAEFDDWEMAGGEEYRFLDVDICRGDISELSPILICNIVRFLKKQQHFNVKITLCGVKFASFPDSDYKIDESIADAFSQSSRRSASSKSEVEESKFGNFFTDFLQNVTRTVTQIIVDMMNSLSDFFNNLLGSNKVFFNADRSAKLGAVEMTLGASFRLGSHGYDDSVLQGYLDVCLLPSRTSLSGGFVIRSFMLYGTIHDTVLPTGRISLWTEVCLALPGFAYTQFELWPTSTGMTQERL